MVLTSAVHADPPPKNHGFSTIDDVDRHLRDFIMKRFPKAEFSVTADTFVVKAKTMKYIVHHQHRGQVSERTYETEGPRHDGILLKIERRNGRYGGPLFLPQTLREPYWNATVNEIVDSRTRTYLWVSYEWGRLIDKGFHKDLKKRLHCHAMFPEDFDIISGDGQ